MMFSSAIFVILSQSQIEYVSCQCYRKTLSGLTLGQRSAYARHWTLGLLQQVVYYLPRGT